MTLHKQACHIFVEPKNLDFLLCSLSLPCVKFIVKKSFMKPLIFAPKILGIPNIVADSERSHERLSIMCKKEKWV